MPSNGRRRTSGRNGTRTLPRRNDPAPILPILARRVREVEAKSVKGKVGPTNRVKFQVIALLVREERARIKSDEDISGSARTEILKRLDGVAQILARTAAQDTSLLSLLDPDTDPGPAAQRMRNDWLLESGAELSEEELIAYLQEHIARFKVPKAIRFVDSLPRNQSGKLLKRELRG